MTARRNHWDPAVPWAVPRDLQWERPAGLQWAAAGRLALLGPQHPRQVIRPEDWGEAIAPRIDAVMVVSAVYCHALCTWPMPDTSAIYTRRPSLFPMRPGASVTETPAESRTGELWAFPLSTATAEDRQPS